MLCLFGAVNCSVTPSNSPSNSLMSEGHRVQRDQPVNSPQSREDKPVRPVIQPAYAAPLQLENNPVKFPSTKPFVTTKLTVKPTAKPVVASSLKPSKSPNCAAKNFESDGKKEDEESVPCPTASPSYKKSTKPTFSTGSLPSNCPTAAPSNDPTTRLTKKPTWNPTIKPFVSLNPTIIPSVSPTFNPTKKPTVSITLNPSAKPTPVPVEVLVTFNTYLNIQLVDCNALKLCTACHHAIELSQQQLINSTIHRLANVTYINCIVGRRRLSEMSRHLMIQSNVTLITTFYSQNPTTDSDTVTANVFSSVQNGEYTKLLQDNSLKSNATETENVIVRAVAVGTSSFSTLSPTVQPLQISTTGPFSSKTILTSATPSFNPSLRPVIGETASPSDIPSNNPSKRFITQSPTITPSNSPSLFTSPTTITSSKIASYAPSKKTSANPIRFSSTSTTSNPSAVGSSVAISAPSTKPSKTPSIAPIDIPSTKPQDPNYGNIAAIIYH